MRYYRNMNKWNVTKDMILSISEIDLLYKRLEGAKNRSLHTGRNRHHVRDFFILKVLLESGVRVFELVDIKVGDLKDNSLTIPNGKGGKKRSVILTWNTWRLIQKFLHLKVHFLNEPIKIDSFLFLSERKKPYSTRGVRKRVKFWFKQSGFSDRLSCHSCRHSYISHLISKGVDLATVRENVGHSSLATTSLYTHICRSDLGIEDIYNSSVLDRSRHSSSLSRSETFEVEGDGNRTSASPNALLTEKKM